MRKHTVLTALALTFSLIVGIQLVITQVKANVIPANVDIRPNSLLLKEGGYGKWITAHIWFSEEDYDVNNIDISSVTLEVMGGHVPVSRYNIKGNVLMVKFDRAMVIDFLWPMIQHMAPHVKHEVPLKVMGNLYDHNTFEGIDTIQVFYTHL